MFGVRMRRFGELEAVIMDRLWEWGRPVLVREVVDALRDERGLAYTTVMTVMENLYRKGWLRRERDGRAWRYEPTGSRSGYTAALMNDALATSPDRRTALAHFALQMSPHDAAMLREALDQALGEHEAGGSRGPSPRYCCPTRPVSASWGLRCSAVRARRQLLGAAAAALALTPVL